MPPDDFRSTQNVQEHTGPPKSTQAHPGAHRITQEHPDNCVYKGIDANPLVNLVYKVINGSPL